MADKIRDHTGKIPIVLFIVFAGIITYCIIKNHQKYSKLKEMYPDKK